MGRNFTANGAFGTLIVFMIWLYFIATMRRLNVIIHRVLYHTQNKNAEGVMDEKKKNLMYDAIHESTMASSFVLLLAFISIATLFSTTYLISGIPL